MEDTTRIRLEPANVLWLMARKNAKARAASRIICYNWLVLREIEGIKREWEIHDDCVGTGNSKVVHHLGRFDPRNCSVDEIAR